MVHIDHYGDGYDEFAVGVAVDSGGRIFVVSNIANGGTSRVGVNRLTAAGQPDAGFAPPFGDLDWIGSSLHGDLNGPSKVGGLVVRATGIAVDGDDNVLVCGYQSGGSISGTKMWLARYLKASYKVDWVKEENFGAADERAHALAAQADKKHVVVGRYNGGFFVTRLVGGGAGLNDDFNGDGNSDLVWQNRRSGQVRDEPAAGDGDVAGGGDGGFRWGWEAGSGVAAPDDGADQGVADFPWVVGEGGMV